MVSKRHLKAKQQWKRARGHLGKQAHATETEAIAHARALRRKDGGRMDIYGCGEGRTDPNQPRHWHVGHA